MKKFKEGSENFFRCTGDGKIHAAKIGGTFTRFEGIPGIRKGMQAAPSEATKVESDFRLAQHKFRAPRATKK